MANQWFKFYGAEYLSDPKMDRLSVQERSCWLTLLCMASQTDGTIKYISVEGLLNKSGIRFDPFDTTEWEKAQNVLVTFEQYEMIIIHKDGVIEIKNWDKRQERTAQTPYERVKKHRENKRKIENDNENDNGDNENDNDRIEENRIEENTNTSSQSSDKPQKKKYGHYKNVLLSDEERSKLKERFGEEEYKRWVTTMDEGVEMKGYKYKSHYLAILKWSKDETKGAKSSVYDKARKLEKIEQEQRDISSVELSKEETERRNEMLQRMKTIGVTG